MSDQHMKDILEKIAARSIPEDTNLMPRIAAELERKTFMQNLRARPLIATLLALLLLVILSGVVYAISRSLGFSPGLGVVETSSLRMLAEPVSLERDGFRMTVTEAGVDAAHTVIRYQVEWLTPAPAEGEFDSSCQGNPTLTLPDGSLVGQGVGAAGGKGALENGYWLRLEFPPVAIGQDDVSLDIPCLTPLIQGPLPRAWHFPLHLIPWDGTPLAPVHQAPTPIVTQTLVAEPQAPAAPEYAITFALEQVIELADGYIFEGSAIWTDGDIQAYSVSPESAHLTDATGRVIALDRAQPQTSPSGTMQNRWAFQSAEKPSAFPLTLTLDRYTFRLDTDVTFPFDPGASPQPGQTWSLNLDVPVAGHILVIDSVTWMKDPGVSSLVFNISSDPGVVGAGLFDLQNTPGQGGGGGGPAQPGPFIASVYYENGLPSGVIQVSIKYLEIAVKTPWQTTWQP